MERRLKLGISRMFSLSFFSCRHTLDASDMAHDPIFISGRDFQHPLIRPPPPPPPPPVMKRFPSLCRSRKPVEGPNERRTKPMCPPAPPASPLNSCCRNMDEVDEMTEKGKRQKRTRKKRSRYRSKKTYNFTGKENFETSMMIIPSTSSADSYCFFSSEEEREVKVGTTETLFSRKSFSSDSSWESRQRRRRALRRRTTSRRRLTKIKPRKEKYSNCSSDNDAGESAHLPAARSVSSSRVLLKGGFAVVKRSSDPHADFRSSMVEMIMEKQIFGARELEQLLYCFLSLNSPSHHQAILDVFEEICAALFSTWS